MARGSSRRARRRTLFSTVGARRSERTAALPAADEAQALEGTTHAVEIELEEFVVDDDDYPVTAADHPRVAPASSTLPDRVDDIDEWVEEFAVEDRCDTLPG